VGRRPSHPQFPRKITPKPIFCLPPERTRFFDVSVSLPRVPPPSMTQQRGGCCFSRLGTFPPHAMLVDPMTIRITTHRPRLNFQYCVFFRAGLPIRQTCQTWRMWFFLGTHRGLSASLCELVVSLLLSTFCWISFPVSSSKTFSKSSCDRKARFFFGPFLVRRPSPFNEMRL